MPSVGKDDLGVTVCRFELGSVGIIQGNFKRESSRIGRLTDSVMAIKGHRAEDRNFLSGKRSSALTNW
jgi:hypothetical protein